MYNPWIKAIDLQQWAPRSEARFTLPALVRRLVWATTEGKRVFSFPAGEGVQRPSWDGRLTVEQGNVWVPDQSSVWELSTGDPPAAKAAENYQKRTAEFSRPDAAQLAFVFVTPLKWTAKLTWAADKKAENYWRDVRVLDCDDLEHWLETAPAVDTWLARLVGKVPTGIRDLSHYWGLLAALTKPPLPAAAFQAGREAARSELARALEGNPREIAVAASSEQELVDFIAAAFGSLGEDDPLPARSVVVESLEAWNQIVASTEPLVLLPGPGFAVTRTAIAQAVTAGHHVITRRYYSTQAEAGVIRLPRAWRHELSDSLIKAGFGDERAGRLASECGGYLAVLQRLAVPNSGTAAPEWAENPDGELLTPFALLGSWDDSKKADRDVVAQLFGDEYDKALALASGWLLRSESPFRRSGTKWLTASREDAWIHLAPRLTRAQVDLFANVAVSVLSEDDPRFELDPERRAFAALHGKLPRHSGELREGLAETLALLGAELVQLPALPTGAGSGLARRVVRDLLSACTKTQRWFTLSPILRLLAEAAPEEFLDAVERDIAGPQPALVGLFADDDGGIFGSSRHCYLMWALTALAWHPAYLARATLALARLAALDPGAKTSPTPRGSLHDIFRPWFPQTAANAVQRFQVIDLLIEREPAQAWTLLMAILPKGHDHASGTSPPRWREWPAVKKPQVTSQERWEQWSWTGKRLLKEALLEPPRLLELANNIEHLLEDEFQALVAHFLSVDPKSKDNEHYLELWNRLSETIRRHEFFHTAEWRMADERLCVLRKVESHLRPEDPADRGRWLFAEFDLSLGTHPETAFDAQEVMALVERTTLLTEIFGKGGVPKVAEFAASVRYPGLVGDVLARTPLCPDPSHVLPKYLDCPSPGTAIFARAYAGVVFGQRGWSWIETLSLERWSADAATQLLLALPFDPQTWDLARSLGLEVEQRYWTRVRPFSRGLTSEQASRGLKRLLEHNRPLDAADFLRSVYYNRLTVPARLLEETLEKCVPALNETVEASHDLSNLIHDLGRLLGHLQDAPDNEPTRVAQLEWTYLPLMKSGNASPKYLHQELGRNPAFYAECIELMWPKDVPDDSAVDNSEVTAAKSRLAYNLLESWPIHPSLQAKDRPDEAALQAWIDEVRRRCAASGRMNSGDHEIGKLLSSSPTEPDATWPCIAVRNVLESIPGEIALDAFRAGVFNARGATTRGLREGGDQERKLARVFHGYADASQTRWPRLAATLRRLAIIYETDARHMDEQADDRG